MSSQRQILKNIVELFRIYSYVVVYKRIEKKQCHIGEPWFENKSMYLSKYLVTIIQSDVGRY